jgi:hypothetical protein
MKGVKFEKKPHKIEKAKLYNKENFMSDWDASATRLRFKFARVKNVHGQVGGPLSLYLLYRGLYRGTESSEEFRSDARNADI